MRKDFIDIYLYAKKKGFIIELFTNGALINSEIIEILHKYPPLLVDVSIYGACEETYRRVTGVCGAFERVMSNCRDMIAAGIRVALKSPVLTLTLSELGQMKALALSIGVPFRASFEIIPTIDKDNITEQFQIPLSTSLEYEFLESLSKTDNRKHREKQRVSQERKQLLFRCKIGGASCIIDYTGRMCPCMKFKHVGGKITRESFDTVWNSFEQYQKLRVNDSYKCLNCDAYAFCDICPAEMDFLHNDMQYIDCYYCSSARARQLFYDQGATVDEAISLVR